MSVSNNAAARPSSEPVPGPHAHRGSDPIQASNGHVAMAATKGNDRLTAPNIRGRKPFDNGAFFHKIRNVYPYLLPSTRTYSGVRKKSFEKIFESGDRMPDLRKIAPGRADGDASVPWLRGRARL